jgi:gliding motility-associated-like protein
MKQLYKAVAITLLMIITLQQTLTAQVTFLKTIDLHALNFGQALTRTRDKGYVIVGQDKQFIHAISSYCYFYYAKIDSCSNLAKTQLYEYTGQPRIEGFGPKAVIESSVPNKYVVTGTVRRLDASSNLSSELVVMQLDDATGAIDWLNTHASPAGEAQGANICEAANGYVACGYVDEAAAVKTPYLTMLNKTTGAFMWEKSFPSLAGTYSYANYVEAFSNGDILLLGAYGNGANNNFYAMRLSSTGTVLWSKEYDVAPFDGLDWDMSGKVTSDGNFLLSGSTKPGTNFNTVIIKANGSTGEVIHTGMFDNAGQDDRGRTITELRNGDYVQMGNSEVGASTSHTLMNKIDKNFNYKWSRTMTLNNYSKAWGVNEEGDKGIIFSGLTTSNWADYLALFVKTDSMGSLSASCNYSATPSITYNTPLVTAAGITPTESGLSYFIDNIPLGNFINPQGVGTMNVLCYDCSPLVTVSKPAICPLDTFYVVTAAIPCVPHTLVVADVVNGIPVAPFKTKGDTLFYILTTPGDYAIVRNTNCNGSPNVITKNITVHPTPVAVITSAPSICQGDKDTLFAITTVGTAPYTYTWGGAGVPTINNDTVALNTNATINATLQVKDSYKCKSAVATYTLENYPLPQPTFTVDPVCLKETSIFINTTPQSPTIAGNSWFFYNGANVSLGTSAVVNPTFLYKTCYEAFTAKLIATTDKGCIDSVTNNLIVHCLPKPNFTFVNDCEKDAVIHFTNTSNNGAGTTGAMNSLWFLDVLNPTETNSNPSKVYFTAGEYPITLQITDVYGCKKDTLKKLKVYPKPNANFTVASVCINDESKFINTTTLNVPPVGGFTDNVDGQQWDYNFDNNLFTMDATTVNAQYTYPLTATETKPLVTLIVKTNNNCKDTITLPVIVWTRPTVNYTVDKPCYPNAMNFVNSTSISAGTDNSAVATMIEKWGDNKIETIPQLNTTTTHSYATSGNYNTVLVATSNHGCADSLTVPTVIHAKPKALFDIAPPQGCEPLCVAFTNNSTQNKSPIIEFIKEYEWNLGDYNDSTNATNQPTTRNANYCYENPSDTLQKHDVKLIVTTDQGCKDTLFKPQSIAVFPLPVANFKVSPTVTDMLNAQVYITDQSHLADVIEWNYDDGHTKSVRNAAPLTSMFPYNYIYADSGTFVIRQLVSTDLGCIDTAQNTLRINPMYTIYIPNSFTPNADGINDYFRPSGINIKDMDLIIFDRWGVIIARIQGWESKGWDGTDYRTGEKCKTEVYNWKLNYVDVFNENHTNWIGTVTLVK